MGHGHATMADITTRPYGRTRRTSPDRAGWARLCARYEVLAARMGMAATEAGGHCSEYYFILVRPRRPRCDDACRAKLCAPHQTVRSSMLRSPDRARARMEGPVCFSCPCQLCFLCSQVYPPPLHLPARTAPPRVPTTTGGRGFGGRWPRCCW